MKATPETCTDIQAALPLFVGFDLEAHEMEQVSGHLESCSACRALAGRAEAAREVWKTLRDEEDRRALDFWSRVRAGLVSEGRLGVEPARRTASAFPLGLASAAAAAVLFVGLSRLFEPVPTAPASLGAPQLVAESASSSPAVVTTPASTGGLRRARPGEERLLDQARSLGGEFWVPWETPQGAALAGSPPRTSPVIR